MSFTPGPSLPSNDHQNNLAHPAPQQPAAAPAEGESPEALGSLGRRVLLGAAGVAGLAVLANRARAGQLSPPAGPITATGVTLAELGAKTSEAKLSLNAIDKKVAKTEHGVAEPRTPIEACPIGPDGARHITLPGAYCFTQDYDQPAAHLIVVDCDDVSIDGQGFTCRGGPIGSLGSVVAAVGRSNIELFDLTISSWQGCPIDCPDCDDVDMSDIHFRHCTCPPGYFSDGSPPAMVRCRDGACLYDVDFTECTGCTVSMRKSGELKSADFRSCSGPAVTCAEDCSIEDMCITLHSSPLQAAIVGGDRTRVCDVALSLSGCSACDLGARSSVDDIAVCDCSSSSPMMSLGADSSLCDFEGRRCTCTAGWAVCGARCVCEDGCFTEITGDCLTCADGCCCDDLQFASCTGRGISGGVGAVVNDVSFHGQQGDCILLSVHGSCCDVECRACTGVAITCGSGACVEEVAISSHTGDCVRCADGSCVTEVECRGCVGVCISVGPTSLIEDCDVSGGGGGGSYRCLDGSTISSCSSRSRQASVDIRVTDRCCVEDCTISQGVGIDCGAECCVSANELSSCVERPPSTLGLCGAITVFGPHTSIDDNQLTECPVSISVLSNAHFCSVDDNHISSSQVAGIAGGAVAGIVIAAGVASVMCTCNHLRVAPGVPPFVAGSSSFGPIVVLPAGGGDLSSSPSSAHHLANFVVS